MASYETIEVKVEGAIATLWLNRPEVHNAFNALMVQEISEALTNLSSDQINALVIRGKGNSFCAGADINWMKDAGNLGYKENYQDSLMLALCLHKLYTFPVPVLAIAHGVVYGGGIGLLAVADIALCSKDTKFCFSEVTIGLVPAVISPYVIRRVGEFKAKEWMLLANSFLGEEAVRCGLVNGAEESYNLETLSNEFIRKFMQNSPEATRETKKLILRNTYSNVDDALIKNTAEIITRARTSPSGQEGMRAFLEKRKPRWK